MIILIWSETIMDKIFLVDVYADNGMMIRRQVVHAIPAKLPKNFQGLLGLPDLPIEDDIVYLPEHSGLSVAGSMVIVECIDVPSSLKNVNVVFCLTTVDASGNLGSPRKITLKLLPLEQSLLPLNALILNLGNFRHTEAEREMCLKIKVFCNKILTTYKASEASISNIAISIAPE
jgi:hypothetical protein